jgi:hypothetical protein
LTLSVNPNTVQDILGDQAAVITVGDVPNLQTTEIVKNDILIRRDGLLPKHFLHYVNIEDLTLLFVDPTFR